MTEILNNMNSPFYLFQVLDLFSEESGLACILLNLNKEIIYLNNSATQMYQWSKNDVTGKNFSSLCRAQSIEDVCSKYLITRKFDQPITGKLNHLTLPHGQMTIVQWDFFPLKNEKNKTVGILMIGMDFKKNLQSKNTYLYNIINNVPHFIFWKNRNSVYLGCNKIFAEGAGLADPGDIIGLTDYDLPWTKSESDAYRADDKAVMDSNQPKLNIEETQTLPDIEPIFLLTSKVPLHDKHGQVNGMLGVYSDITDLKKTQAALKNAEGQVKGMELVSATVAHELRTPLASIAMGVKGIEKYLGVLLEAYQLAQQNNLPIKPIPKEQQDILSTVLNNISEEANQAHMVIDMLLANLSMQKAKHKREMLKLSMADYVTKALNQYVFPPGKREKVHEDLEQNFMFYGDGIFLAHIIFNLLKNSLYFIDKARKGEIHIWLESHRQYNELHFKDTARGIREEHMPNLFKQFFTKDTHHGTGIGLAFCKAVMESWGGKITCKSVFGEYTEFICQFPKNKPKS